MQLFIFAIRSKVLAKPRVLTGLWQALAGSQMALSLYLIHSTQHWPSATLVGLVAWGGAAICAEEHLSLQPKPTKFSLAAGLATIIYTSWRSSCTLDQDSIVYALPILQGFGLAMLAVPIRELSRLKESLIVLSFLPLQFLIGRILSESWLNHATARLTQLNLLLLDQDATVTGNVVKTGSTGVAVIGACNGLDLITQLTMIAATFAVAFPLKNKIASVLFVGAAPLAAAMTNSVRITILAILNLHAGTISQSVFDFLHDQWGALLFAGIATAVMGQIYVGLIDRELNAE